MTERNEIRVSKVCPKCNWRLFDKVSPANGYVEIKCPQCKSIVRINLAFRSTVRYRLASPA